MEQQRFNVSETATILGCSAKTIKRYVDEGTLRTLPTFEGAYFSKAEIERVLSCKGEIKSLREIELEDQVRRLNEQNQNLQMKLNKIKDLAI